MPPIPETATIPINSTEIAPELSTVASKNRTTVSMVNSHQGHWDDEVTEKVQGTTIEPLGPIMITDPSTVEPAATAGKWPIELDDDPIIDSVIDNET